MTITTGTRFSSHDARPYTENGERRIHETTVLCEVTSTDDRGFAYTVIEVLTETGRPSFAGTKTGGNMAWFGWEAALANGRVAVA